MESAELIAILREARERVRAQNPESSAGEVPLPDLLPLVHARDAALGKVAAIGTVNPRPGGVLNALAQAWKKLLARTLDWHVREQVEFNRNVVATLDAAIEALSETNRSLSMLAGRIPPAREFLDIRNHWADWRAEWERKLSQNEMQFLRSVADMQAAFQHRQTLMDANYRDAMRGQHAEFMAAMELNSIEVQKRLWADLERVRTDFERLIHAELRVIRQRALVASPAAAPEPAPAAPRQVEAPPALDFARFAERFRGTEEYVKAGQQFYLPHFAGCCSVLDIGCGRGEFLEALRAAGVAARGIDLSAECVALCRNKGLEAEAADLFEYLAAQPEGSFDGIFCSQVVEHLAPERLPAMIGLAASRLTRNGVIAIETPNPECLAVFATHFYLDPTHARPVPHPLLAFYLEEAGLSVVEMRRLSPAVGSMPSLASLPADFRDAFFGGLDYAIIGRKL